MTEEKVVVKEKVVKPTKKTTSSKAASVPAPAPLPGVPEKHFSFEQWAARRGVPKHHRGGLRAFVNNATKNRTIKEWDKCFEGY